MPFVIRLESKHTGEAVWLGSQFESRVEADVYIESEVCTRCNRVEVLEVRPGQVWRNRKDGFMYRNPDDLTLRS